MTDQELDYFMARVLMDSIQLDLEQNVGKIENTFQPSSKYQRQVKAMLKDPQGWRKRKLRPVWRTIAQRVALLLLALSLGFGAVMAGSPTARAAFMNWLKEVYDTYVVYRFMGEDIGKEMPHYEITALPEGFVEVERLESTASVSVIYENDAGDVIYFNYCYMQQGVATAFDTENADVLPITVSGLSGELYLSTDPENISNTIVWVDEELNISFDLGGFYRADDILHIAESVSLSKTTK